MLSDVFCRNGQMGLFYLFIS